MKVQSNKNKYVIMAKKQNEEIRRLKAAIEDVNNPQANATKTASTPVSKRRDSRNSTP